MTDIAKAREAFKSAQQYYGFADRAKCDAAAADCIRAARHFEAAALRAAPKWYAKAATAAGLTPLEPYDLQVQRAGDRRPPYCP